MRHLISVFGMDTRFKNSGCEQYYSYHFKLVYFTTKIQVGLNNELTYILTCTINKYCNWPALGISDSHPASYHTQPLITSSSPSHQPSVSLGISSSHPSLIISPSHPVPSSSPPHTYLSSSPSHPALSISPLHPYLISSPSHAAPGSSPFHHNQFSVVLPPHTYLSSSPSHPALSISPSHRLSIIPDLHQT